MIRKAALLVCLSILAINNCRASDKFSVALTSHDIGTWAYKQHLEICNVIYTNITNGNLSAYDPDNRKYKKESIQFLDFVDTIKPPNEPYILLDYWNITNYDRIVLDNSMAFIYYEPIKYFRLHKEELFKLLSVENLLYLKEFQRNNQILSKSIPIISKELITSANYGIFNDNKLKSDSLTNKHKSTEVIVFISTDPLDPTIGRDSVFQYAPSSIDSQECKSLVYVFELTGFDLKIDHVSCGIMLNIPEGNRKMQYDKTPHSYGYLAHDQARNVIGDNEILECSLRQLILRKFHGNTFEYENYLWTFSLNKDNY